MIPVYIFYHLLRECSNLLHRLRNDIGGSKSRPLQRARRGFGHLKIRIKLPPNKLYNSQLNTVSNFIEAHILLRKHFSPLPQSRGNARSLMVLKLFLDVIDCPTFCLTPCETSLNAV